MASRPTTSTHWALCSKGSRWALSSSVRLWILLAWWERAEQSKAVGRLAKTHSHWSYWTPSGNNGRLHSRLQNLSVQRWRVVGKEEGWSFLFFSGLLVDTWQSHGSEARLHSCSLKASGCSEFVTIVWNLRFCPVPNAVTSSPWVS